MSSDGDRAAMSAISFEPRDRRNVTSGLAELADEPPVGARVLIIVPDLAFAATLACRIAEMGNSAKVAATARSAERFLETWPADAVVVDLDTEGFPARRVIRELRARRSATVLLRRHAEPAERVRWLNDGASDFVPSPISLDEVVARVASVLRRRDSSVDRRWTMVVGSVCLDDTTGEVEVDGRRRLLSPMEFKLLRHLAGEPGTVFSRHDLLRDVWGYTTGGDATVTVHIRKLREKIETDSERPSLIRTRRGIGYYLSLDGAA